MGKLDGRVALVCGASMGIGAAIAARFKAEGAEVYGLARNRERLEGMGYDASVLMGMSSVVCRV